MRDCQNDRLLSGLRNGPLTALQIQEQFGIMRAAARVHELRCAGHNIRSRQVEVVDRRGRPCRVAEYSIATAQRTLLPEMPGRGVMTA